MSLTVSIDLRSIARDGKPAKARSTGPTTRPALKSEALSAIAFGSSSRPTSWYVSACRFGASKTSAAPPRKASPKYGQGS